MAEPLPREVLDLIQHCLPTMEHVELLIALARDEAQTCTPVNAAALVKATVAGTQVRLADLERAGLLVSDPPSEAYRYAPVSVSLRQATEELRRMYSSRPVSLVRAIYERPSSAIRSFADAFRLRRPEDEEKR